MWKNKTLLLLLITIIFESCGQRKLQISDPNYDWIEISHQNFVRRAVLYFPDNYEKINFTLDPNVRTFPLMIGLHGGGGDHETFLSLSKGRLLKLKEKYGFFLVLPLGYKNHWNDGRKGRISKSHTFNIDDVGFLLKLIEYLKKHYPIDENRIFLFGISNGGMMAFRFACERSETIRGFATVATSMPVDLISNCQSSIRKPLKFLFIHGTKDPIVPYEGGEVKVFFRSRGVVLSAEDTLDFWKKKLQCKPTKSSFLSQAKVQTEVLEFDCKKPNSMKFYKVHQGGHTWPGGLQYLPEWYVGKTADDFWAEEVMIQFFLEKN
ncbi:MAG: hypothetical protein NZ853_00670 [Leptospiraceae bacterium]|nr:hypothetical protein [Leptospiraceae bacterium]MDW7976259.1 hypothetical protein [Leptospiraceae bacterium]